jgi:hypothetical protein
MANFLNVIAPYKYEGCWVFDDDRHGLVKEPFVFGADKVIDWLVADIEDADRGFKLLFADRPFPGYQARFEWLREEYEGNWYVERATGQEGWLCPALFHYFATAPKEIFVLATTRA